MNGNLRGESNIHFSWLFKGSGDSNYSHHESDFDLEESNRESLRRDAERSAALQLERAKVEDIFL